MFDGVLDAASAMLDCPIAVIDVRSETFSGTSSRISPPLDSPQVRSALQQNFPRMADSLVVGDTCLSVLPADDPVVESPPVVRALVSVPLVLEDGSNLGSLCALDVRSREFAPTVEDQMKSLASCATSMIEIHLAMEQSGQDHRRAEARAVDAEHREQLLKVRRALCQVRNENQPFDWDEGGQLGLGLLIIGSGVGLLCFFLALILGHSFLAALLLYSVTGCLTVFTGAVLRILPLLRLRQFAMSGLRGIVRGQKFWPRGRDRKADLLP